MLIVLPPNYFVKERSLKEFRRNRKCRHRNMEAGARSRRFTPDESAIANLNAPRSIAFSDLPRIH